MESGQHSTYGTGRSSAVPPIDPLLYGHQTSQDPPFEAQSPNDSSSPGSSHSATSPNQSNQRSKQRACDRCRQLKVRCIRDENPADSKCLRCRSAKQTSCITTPPTRKRKRAAVDWKAKVADLEQQMQHKDGDWKARFLELEHKFSSLREKDDTFSSISDSLKSVHTTPMERVTAHANIHSVNLDDLKNEVMSRPEIIIAKAQSLERQAILINATVDKIIDGNTAEFLFRRYVTELFPMFPVVHLQESTALELRRHKPFLFLTIINISSFGRGRCSPGVTKTLNELFLEQFGEICRTGMKSLELVQALLLAVLWYRPPESLDRLNFSIITHVALGIAHELEITKPCKPSEAATKASLDARRALLTCYYMTMNATTIMKRPIALRSSKYIEECIEFLENSTASPDHDRTLCRHIKLARISQSIAEKFQLDDPRDISFADPGTVVALEELEGDLDVLREQWQESSTSLGLNLELHVVEICMHEIALLSKHIPVSAPEKLSTRSLARANRLRNAFQTAMKAAFKLVNQWASQDMHSLFNLPVVFSVRVIHALRTLMAGCSLGPKMFLHDANYNAQAFVNEVDQAFGIVIGKFEELVAYDDCSPQARHIRLAKMLRSKLELLKENPLSTMDQSPADCGDLHKAAADDAAAAAAAQSLRATTAKTPLHLLSDVAARGLPNAYTSPATGTSSGAVTALTTQPDIQTYHNMYPKTNDPAALSLYDFDFTGWTTEPSNNMNDLYFFEDVQFGYY